MLMKHDAPRIEAPTKEAEQTWGHMMSYVQSPATQVVLLLT